MGEKVRGYARSDPVTQAKHDHSPVTLLVAPGGRCRGLGQLLWA